MFTAMDVPDIRAAALKGIADEAAMPRTRSGTGIRRRRLIAAVPFQNVTMGSSSAETNVL
jgi:hypothetical protein